MKNKEPIRRSSRIPKNNDESLSTGRKRKNSTPVVANPKIRKKGDGGRKTDKNCWICHQLGHDTSCDSCPRVYHSNCIKKRRLRFDASGFCECRAQFLSRGNDTSTKYSPTELELAIHVAQKEDVKKTNQRSQSQSTGSKFWKYFQTWPENIESRKLCEIIDLSRLIDRVKQNYYMTTAECFSDMKWIYHNCYILHGAYSEITETALKLEKKFKQELLELEACGECYYNKHKHLLENAQDEQEQDYHVNFFIRVCKEPHDLIWAKMRGSPYWPAKCLRISNGYASVSFFGTHDTSSIQLSQCFRISLKSPNNKEIKRGKLLYFDALSELKAYVSNYCDIYDRFPYYPYRTPLVESKVIGPKKPHKRGSHRRNQSKKQLNDSSLSECPHSSTTIDEPSYSSRGLFSRSSITIEDPSYSIEGVQTNLDASLQHSQTDSSISPSNCEIECAELPSKRSNASEPIAVCMTFTTDDETDLYNQISTPSVPMEHLTPTTSYSPIIGENSDFLQSTNALVQHKLNSGTEPNLQGSSPDFVNSGSSDLLPMITSVSAEVAMNPSFAPEEPDCFSKETLLPSTEMTHFSNLLRNCASISGSENSYASNLLSEQGKVFYANSVEIEEDDDDDDDDDVKVLKQDPPKASKTVNAILNNSGMAHALSQILTSNRPHLQELYKKCQDFGLKSFLQIWLSLNLKKHDENDVLMFLEFYNKVSKANEGLKRENLSLKEQNLSLKEEILSLKGENLSLKEENLTLKGEGLFLRQEKESLNQEKYSLKEIKDDFKLKNKLLRQMNENLRLDLEKANERKINADRVNAFMNTQNAEQLKHDTQQLETLQMLNDSNLKKIDLLTEKICEIGNNLLQKDTELNKCQEKILQQEDELKSALEKASCTISECQTTLSDLPDNEMYTLKELEDFKKACQEQVISGHAEQAEYNASNCGDFEIVTRRTVTQTRTASIIAIEEDEDCPSFNPGNPQIFGTGSLFMECTTGQPITVVSSPFIPPQANLSSVVSSPFIPPQANLSSVVSSPFLPPTIFNSQYVPQQPNIELANNTSGRNRNRKRKRNSYQNKN